jgi:hypothetical protein
MNPLKVFDKLDVLIRETNSQGKPLFKIQI